MNNYNFDDNDFFNDEDISYQSYSQVEKKPRNKKKKTKLLFIILLIIVIALVIIVVKNSIGDSDTTTTTNPDSTTTTLPQNYTTVLLTEADIAKGELVLVNGTYYYEYDSQQGLKNLYDVQTNSYYLKDANTILVNKDIWPSINAWLDDFYKTIQKRSINIIGAFRSHTDQMKIFESFVEQYGSEDEAKKYAQPQGHSEHHTGLCIDLQIWDSDKQAAYTFKAEGEYKWLVDNAHNYGFIQRYPEGKTSITGVAAEPGHFRYIGVAHATAMKQNNASCLETYLDFLKNYTFEGDHLIVQCENGDKYEIYYSSSLTVHVPADREYTISGNNIDGFIVTIKN